MGIDIIEIHRIERAVHRSPKFLLRVFTEKERTYFEKVSMKSETITGFFAAKEAVGKALGTGIPQNRWKDIEIFKNSNGKPGVCLYGRALEIAKNMGIASVLVSISHCKTYAVANAIAM